MGRKKGEKINALWEGQILLPFPSEMHHLEINNIYSTLLLEIIYIYHVAKFSKVVNNLLHKLQLGFLLEGQALASDTR